MLSHFDGIADLGFSEDPVDVVVVTWAMPFYYLGHLSEDEVGILVESFSTPPRKATSSQLYTLIEYALFVISSLGSAESESQILTNLRHSIRRKLLPGAWV